MQIGKDTVVSISYELSDKSGKVLEKSAEPVAYLHGGYHGIFPALEAALEGKGVGDSLQVELPPEDAFGEYDAELVRVEAREAFPENISVGMQFEGAAENSDDVMIYTVTDIADGQVVVDANHPLAGQTLAITCQVEEVRAATAEEVAHGHIHGPHGHAH
ncbi:MAG: peptidylprolyl isomerase [Betaproteobacteria bacterium]|nr:peptidylprolyl isomerase [Betaproteobacteria bacterium]